MSLVHPQNPALWADGSPRSTGNAFTQSWYRVDSASLERVTRHSARSTASVSRLRAQGRELTVRALMARNPKHIHSKKTKNWTPTK